MPWLGKNFACGNKTSFNNISLCSNQKIPIYPTSILRLFFFLKPVSNSEKQHLISSYHKKHKRKNKQQFLSLSFFSPKASQNEEIKLLAAEGLDYTPNVLCCEQGGKKTLALKS